MITRTSLANEIDTYDQSIADLNGGKGDCFDAYRDQLFAAGYSKPAVKLEIEAVKAAIKRRRLRAKNAAAVDEKDALVDEVFVEITSAPRAPRATREKTLNNFGSYAEAKGVERPAQKIEEGLKEALAVAKGEAEPARWHHVTDTHEQPETASQSGSDDEVREVPAVASAGTIDPFTSAPAESASDEISAAADRDAGNTPTCALTPRDDLTVGIHSHSSEPTSSPVQMNAGEVPPASPEPISDDDVPAFLKKDKADKPHCLKLKDGHCRIGSNTSALCSDCNNARMKARAA